MKTKLSRLGLIPALLLLLGAAAIASGVTRMSSMFDAYTTGSIPEGVEGLEAYLEYPLMSLLHLIPGILFMLLGPLQLISNIRLRWPRVHHWCGRLFIVSGLLVGGSAVLMAWNFPVIVSHATTVANLLFGAALVAALLIAFRAIKLRDIQRHRAWMIRAYAIGLAVATMRILFGMVYVVTGTFDEAVIPSLIWFTFMLHVVVAEWIILKKFQRGAYS